MCWKCRRTGQEFEIKKSWARWCLLRRDCESMWSIGQNREELSESKMLEPMPVPRCLVYGALYLQLTNGLPKTTQVRRAPHTTCTNIRINIPYSYHQSDVPNGVRTARVHARPENDIGAGRKATNQHDDHSCIFNTRASTERIRTTQRIIRNCIAWMARAHTHT